MFCLGKWILDARGSKASTQASVDHPPTSAYHAPLPFYWLWHVEQASSSCTYPLRMYNMCNKLYRKVSTTTEHSKSTNVHWELPFSISQASWRKTNPQSLFVPHLDTLFVATTAVARPFHWPSPCAHMALLLLSINTQIMFIPLNTCPMRLSSRFAMFVKLTLQRNSQLKSINSWT
jgi:hypothetical protein